MKVNYEFKINIAQLEQMRQSKALQVDSPPQNLQLNSGLYDFLQKSLKDLNSELSKLESNNSSLSSQNI